MASIPPSRDSASQPIEGDSLPPSQSQAEAQEDSTRKPRRQRRREDFPESQASKLWKALENPEGGPVNQLPGGKYNSAGGKPREATWKDAFNFDLFFNKKGPAFYQTGCARDSLLVGMSAGLGVGGLRWIIRGLSRTWVTANYAVGTFAVVGCGMYTWCIRRQKEEAKGIALAVEGMRKLNQKKAKEEAERKAKEEESRLQKAREEEERRRNKTWYKWW